MRIWLLRPVDGLPRDTRFNPWWPWYDKPHGFVIRAETEQAARGIASCQSTGARDSDFAPESWLDADFATCVELTGAGIACVVLADWRSA